MNTSVVHIVAVLLFNYCLVYFDRVLIFLGVNYHGFSGTDIAPFYYGILWVMIYVYGCNGTNRQRVRTKVVAWLLLPYYFCYYSIIGLSKRINPYGGLWKFLTA
jgi:hypothetical protein